MAYFSKRGKGWQARIPWTDSNGKRHSKNKGGFATKALAKKWATQNEALLNQGVAIDKSISLADYFDHWYKTYKEPKVAQPTLNRYKINADVIRNYFGNQLIDKITRSQYQAFLNDYGSGHAPKTVKKLNSCIRACVKSAILDDYLIKDFTQGVAAIGDESKMLKVDYLNVDEIKQLINEAKKKLDWRYPSRFMILTAIYTGMRKEEIQALTWQDIDFIHHTISINKAWRELKNDGESVQHFNNHRFKKTKTESSNRKIKVNQDLLDCLMILRKHSNSNLVFRSEFGTIPTSNALNAKLRGLLADLKLKRTNFHFHSLRHSHVALLLAEDIDIYAISKRLGHSDISITMNTYAYLIDEYKQETDQKIVKALDKLA